MKSNCYDFALVSVVIGCMIVYGNTPIVMLLNGFNCEKLGAWLRHNCHIRLENLRYCTILCLTENKERLI